jgi:hypothetical protein
MVISPLVEIGIVTISLFMVCGFNHIREFGFFSDLLLFYISLVILTFIVLKIVRLICPLKPGVYRYSENPKECYIWNLQGFLFVTNLSLLWVNGLVPIPFRKLFYQLLGAKMGSGLISIGGMISDPSLIEIEENVLIGHDALLLGHLFTQSNGEDSLILGSIKVERGAIVGVRAVVSPGVVIEENATVMAMAFISPNTVIPAGEMWGGIPARRISGTDKKTTI